MIITQDALDRGLGVSLMEQLATQCPETVSLLTTQYRSVSQVRDDHLSLKQPFQIQRDDQRLEQRAFLQPDSEA